MRISTFKLKLTHVIIFVSLFAFAAKGKANGINPEGIYYLSPALGSIGNSIQTNIIIRFKYELNSSFAYHSYIHLSANGNDIPYHLVAQADKQKLILQPTEVLPTNAKIEVSANRNLPTLSNMEIPAFRYSFYTHKAVKFEGKLNEEKIQQFTESLNKNNYISLGAAAPRTIQTDLANQIPFNITTSLNMEDDYYFMASMYSGKERIMVVNGKGQIVFDRRTPFMSLDFKMHEDTTFSYVKLAPAVEDYSIIVMDKNFRNKDTIYAGNGYLLDVHELVKDKNTGNAFILAQRVVTVDMTKILGMGSDNARVLDIIIQEIDSNGVVLFEWKCFDHLPIEDAFNVEFGSMGIIDYVHCNGISLDSDTTLLLSSRHLNEVTRIDRRNGNIIWRLGNRAKSHNFTFLNDTIAFTYQHHSQRLPNGNILLFDNGNFKTGYRYSRGVEYHLDEVNMTAEKVWEYRHSPDIASDFMGSIQRMPNGNTVIGWGSDSPTFTEIDSNNNVVCEGSMPDNILCYRVFKYSIPNIIKSNMPQFSLPNNYVVCKLADPEFSSKFKTSVQPLVQPGISENFQLLNLNANNLYMTMEDTLSNFYSFYTRSLNLKYAHPSLKDSIVCSGPGSIQLKMNDDCLNNTYQWNTNASSNALAVQTTPHLNKFWVTTRNGLFTQIDTFSLHVSPVVNFNIIGEPILDKPFQIHTYSVPYYKGSTYEWKVTNGNVISGFESNAVEVQWSNKPVSTIQSIVTDYLGCVIQTNVDTILYKNSTGAAELANLAGVKIYPMPFQNNLHIESSEDMEFQLMDLNGRVLKSGLNQGNQSTQLLVDELASGVYLLQLQTNKRKLVLKVVKE
jgi:hypothetical protein